MSELKRILAIAGGFLWRTLALIGVLALAVLMLLISVVTGATAENTTENAVTAALPYLSEYPSWIPRASGGLIVLLPIVIAWFLREHAMNQFRTSWSQAKTQAWEYFLGREKRRAGAVLWALLQVDLALVFPFGGLGGAAGSFGAPLQVDKIISPEPEVRYIAQPITQRIQFEKAALRPDGGFEKAGSNLPGGAAEMLQETVCELRSSGCGAAVSLYGFASNEEFKGANDSHWKNLRLADHRAEAVHNALLSLPEHKEEWLIVEPPKRWTPAIKPENAQRPWEEMRKKRNSLVQAGLTGNARNPDADRVVILEWRLDAPCEVPATAEKTEPNKSG